MNKSINKSNWLPRSTGEGSRGMKLLLAVAVLLTACSSAEEASADGTKASVSFTVAQNVSTRATATSAPLTAGSTLRVIAYQHMDGQTGYPEANRRDECTYRVEADGTLSLCAVHADGTVDATGTPQTDMALAPGTYDFYAITPALRVYHEEANPVVAVKHGVDFASGVTQQTIAAGANKVVLTDLGRQCVKLNFKTDRTGALTGITKIRVQSLVLEEMTDEPAWATGTGAISLTNNTYVTPIRVPGSAFSVPAGALNDCQQTATLFCLPRPARDFRLRAEVLYNADTTPTVLETTVSGTALAAGSSNTLNIHFGKEKIKVTAEVDWTSDIAHTDVFGAFDLNAGGLSANCYIITTVDVAQGVDFMFDATVRGNNSTVSGINYSTLPDLSTATEARVIWQTGTSATTGLVVDPASVKLEKKKVIFSPGNATEGNAVIGIFASDAANAPCLWSWHIWRVGTAPATVTGSKTSAATGSSVNVVMMDRNLGAFNNTEDDAGAIGLLYQWGRKDPFPGPSGFDGGEPTNIYGSYNNGGVAGSWTGPYIVQTSTTDATIGTEAWAVKHPAVYIIATTVDGIYNWYWGTRNDNLWGTPWISAGTGGYNQNLGIKSIYDPCPIGYRVPPQDTWSKQTVNGTFQNNGIILGSFHASLWFPVVGLRGASSGNLSKKGPSGYYWTSSPSNTILGHGGCLYVYDTSAIPQSSYARGNGNSVRCVKE